MTRAAVGEDTGAIEREVVAHEPARELHAWAGALPHGGDEGLSVDVHCGGERQAERLGESVLCGAVGVGEEPRARGDHVDELG